MTGASKRNRRTALTALTLVLAAATARPAGAQDLRYTTVTEAEFGGALGRMMGVMPGMDTEVRETTWISGARMRTDGEGTSTIVDMEAGRFTTLDHEGRQYWTFEMADLARSMEAMTEAMREEAGEGRAASGATRAEAGAEQPTRTLEITMSTDRTGDTREIGGFRAERVFVTIEMRAEETAPPPDAADPEAAETRQGDMVLLTELWLTDENLMAVPEELDIEGFREMTAGAMDDWAAMEQAFANDPELRVAFDRSHSALADLTGTTLESTVFWVVVPPDQEFDRDMALADRDRSLGDDVAAAARAGAAESAKNAVRSRLGGLFGGGDDDEEAEEAAEPELVQQTFLRIRTLLEGVDRSPVPASTFEIPDGYTRQELPALGDPGGA